MNAKNPDAGLSAVPIPAGPAGPLLWVRTALLLSFLIFIPYLLEQFEAPKGAVVRVLGLGLLATILASVRGLRRMRWQPLDGAVAGWLVVEILSTMLSVAPRLSLFGDTEQHEGLLTSLGLAGLYLAARWGPASPADLRTTLRVAIAAAVGASIYALFQVAGLDLWNWTRVAAFSAGVAFIRPFGTLGHPNLLGVVTSAVLAAVIPLVADDRRWRWLYAAAAVILGIATLLTMSRAAWLGTVAGGLVAGALLLFARATGRAVVPGASSARRRAGGLLVAALGVGVLLVLVATVAPLRERLSESLAPTGGTGRTRIEIWKSALACWWARPWLGQGPDTIAIVFPRFQTPEYWRFEWGGSVFHAHSIYLHALATRGALGFLAGTAWALALLLAAARAWRVSTAARGLLAALLALLAALAVAGAFGAIGVSGALLLVVASAAVASLAAQDTSATADTVPGALGGRPLQLGIAVAVLALVWSVGDLMAARAAFRSVIARADLRRPGNLEAAAVAADRSVSIKPFDDALARQRAETYVAIGMTLRVPGAALAVAEVSARQAIALAPLRAANHQTLCNVLMARALRGDTSVVPAAEAAYARGLELAPYHGRNMIQFAQEELYLRRPAAALAPARRAAALYPERAEALITLAKACLGVGDRAGARVALERASALDWPVGSDGKAQVKAMLDSIGAGSNAGRAGARQDSRGP